MVLHVAVSEMLLWKIHICTASHSQAVLCYYLSYWLPVITLCTFALDTLYTFDEFADSCSDAIISSY